MAWTYFRLIKGRSRREMISHDKDKVRDSRAEAEAGGARCSSIYYCSPDGMKTAMGEVGHDDYLVAPVSVGPDLPSEQ